MTPISFLFSTLLLVSANDSTNGLNEKREVLRTFSDILSSIKPDRLCEISDLKLSEPTHARDSDDVTLRFNLGTRNESKEKNEEILHYPILLKFWIDKEATETDFNYEKDENGNLLSLEITAEDGYSNGYRNPSKFEARKISDKIWLMSATREDYYLQNGSKAEAKLVCYFERR